MLFDPFEKQFDLPARLVQRADRGSRRAKEIGQEYQGLARLGIFEANASQVHRIVLLAVESGQHNSVVADNAFSPIARCGVDATKVGVRFGTCDKERASLMEDKEAFEIQIAAIHNVNGRGFGNQQIERVDIVQFPVGNVDKTWNIASHIQQRMHLDRRFGAAKRCPRKQRKTKVYRRRV